MSRVNSVLTHMREGREYSAAEIAMAVHLSNSEAGEILRMLVKGRLVDETQGGKYLKLRRYASRQKELFPA